MILKSVALFTIVLCGVSSLVQAGSEGRLVLPSKGKQMSVPVGSGSNPGACIAPNSKVSVAIGSAKSKVELATHAQNVKVSAESALAAASAAYSTALSNMRAAVINQERAISEANAVPCSPSLDGRVNVPADLR